MTVFRYPLWRALLAQCFACLLLFGGLALCAALGGWRPTLWQAAVAQGCLALAGGVWLGLPRWWWPLLLAFVPALLAVSTWGLPAWVPALAFVLLAALNWNGLRERVPLYLTGGEGERALHEVLDPLPPGFAFVDLGCGLGGLLLRLARRYPEARFVGVETAPLSFAIAWLRTLFLGNCRVRYLSLWALPLADFEVVYCFLSPSPMVRLWQKAQAEMTEGALLVSNSFEVPDVPAQRSIELGDWRASRLLLWTPAEARERAALR